ncbi:uncharacterized protein LOC122756552 [Drosophila santomea]|uniref:uncharacterized protein LOC122756552 n=1 Tax=Drosophila santomea TaxID=129105 RepID=UPI001CCF1B0B|nr:uncharacterized protein LOC122756552 [Drosophila santomea]
MGFGIGNSMMRELGEQRGFAANTVQHNHVNTRFSRSSIERRPLPRMCRLIKPFLFLCEVIDKTILRNEWEKWLRAFTIYLEAEGIVTEKRKRMRRIPAALEDKVMKKLDEALSRDIIEPVTGPSAWISPIVLAFKENGDIRLCVDMRLANKAILRENYPLPTFDCFMTRLKEAKFFARLDLKDAYHQLALDESSRKITTFITPRRLFRYKRLMFGVNSAPEIFQRLLEQMLSAVPNAMNFIDDIIIFGATDLEIDSAVKEVCQIFQENNVLLNKEKCIWKTSKLKFFGHILSDKGIEVDPEKIDVIRSDQRPKEQRRNAELPRKALSEVEKRYSQTEKESLALVWAVAKFYYYLAGLHFELVTDHKPLEAIFKPTSKPPARIERWLLRLQAYTFTVIYKSGKENISDALSRLCQLPAVKPIDHKTEYSILRVVQSSIPRSMTIHEIAESSKRDEEIMDAISCLENDSWKPDSSVGFYPFRYELSAVGSLLLRGNRLVVPTSLRVGETAMKRRLRSKDIYFWMFTMSLPGYRLTDNRPGIDVPGY